MNKLIVTQWNNRILTALISHGKAVRLDLESRERQSILGNIYIGKVKNIVKNIDAAFVDLGGGQMGYYSISQNPIHIHSIRGFSETLKAGDEILVQVSRDAVKTKAPVLTGKLDFTGKYVVLTVGKKQLGFSSKIADEHWKEQIREGLNAHGTYTRIEYGLTCANARQVSLETILSELEQLKARYQQILDMGKTRSCYTLLWQSPPGYLSSIRDEYSDSLSEVITDIPQLYEEFGTYLSSMPFEGSGKITLYQDPLLPLCKLYSLETALEEALQKKVWLKSGGYLVIEPTEALVVIDVNTGKYAGKKNPKETIRKINQEAAVEIGRQLRLRNLSGIIIIDFIDMEREEDSRELVALLEQVKAKDPIKTTVVGISKLNLVEVTRKKIRKPVYEQVSEEN
ncbi:MAG: ribonuclease E/G [Lachnospiraceae bacterium]